jgi:hypothetical protein
MCGRAKASAELSNPESGQATHGELNKPNCWHSECSLCFLQFSSSSAVEVNVLIKEQGSESFMLDIDVLFDEPGAVQVTMEEYSTCFSELLSIYSADSGAIFTS